MTNELTEYLTEIADRTRSGDISWNQINPTTYKMDRGFENSAISITIQSARKLKGGLHTLLDGSPPAFEITYLFQIQKEGTDHPILSLSSVEQPDYSEILSKIFDGAKDSMDREALQVLRSLLHK